MKKILIKGLMLFGITAIAQPVSPIYTPVTDMPLMTMSYTTAGLYGSINAEENRLTNSVDSYATVYNKRAIYYTGASVVAYKIEQSILNSRKKLLELVVDNKNLDKIKYYSKRKKNTQLLEELEEKLDILEKELQGQHKIAVIYGEKLNLLQNTMRTLTQINRELDIVDKNIKESNHLKKIIKMIKKEL
ncbi:hypothetical protein [Abyssalbus ytuae]|uniref:DUF4398 domain-containing protein n=1 Tax=Abyssalbus ytuae TaxID=2926907 RepID=A0A9E6ZJE4_9FLAO|nr:hypothetical protein [Abyssalbus ytuae]UOB16667.1 hypothetical protein MQE35_13085 [Abyssalbus ytuae]